MSGGFEPKPKIYELAWGDGTAYPGLEVTAKGMSTSGFFELGEMADALGDPPKAAESRKLLQRFARQLISWNITSGGQPVPADYEHLADLDFDLAMEIFMRWSKAAGGVDPTSPARSNGGPTSQGALPPGLAKASASLAP